jgi:hypothetical protein
MAERKLSLVILGKATGALAALKATGDGAQTLGKRVTDMLPSFKTVALAGAAAFGAVATAAFGAAQAAAQDEQSQKKLADQLRRTTGATDEQIAAVEQHISKQMMLTGVTDDELRPAMANLVRATGDVSFAQSQLNLALDISAATGKDLESVSLALGKAFTGNVGALTKLGVPLEQSVVKSKNLSEVVKTLNEQFGGAAADAADTFSGRLRILQVSLGEAVEGIGYALLPFLERVVAFIQTKVVPVIQAFSDKLASGGGLRDALIAAAATAGDFGLRVINALEPVAKGLVTLGNLFVTVGKPILYVLGAVASAFVLISTRSFSAYKETAESFKGMIDGLSVLQVSTDSVTTAFNNFRNDVLGAAAAANVTQGELRALEQAARQAAAGTSNVVQPFIGPLLKGYGATTTATKTAAQLQAEFAAKLKELQGAAGGAGGKVKEVADAMKTYTDKLRSARDATRSADDATKSVAKAQMALREKTQATTDAQARFDMVVKGFPATAKESIDAARRFADAQRGVRDSGLQVADAVRGVKEAEKALADLRSKQADADKVGSAERSLERSKYGVEEANFRVTDAERELAELRLDPAASPIAIRRAEIDLAEAKLAVSDAVLSVKDAERRLADERNATATPDQIAEAERNLERAKYAVTDALDAQRQATEEQSAAQKNLNEITYGAAVGSAIYDAALKELETAKRDQADASDSLADALRREKDAMYDLIEAQKALLEIQGKTKAGIQNAAAAALGVSVGPGGVISEGTAAISAAGVTGGGGTGKIEIKVETSPFTNPTEVGTEIVDALGAYLRSNGTIPIPVGAFLGVI